MLRISIGCLLLVLAAGPARAADVKKDQPAKAKVHLHIDGKEQEVTFDLKDPKQLDKLAGHLKAGQLTKLEMEQEKSLLEIRYDLGLWSIVVFVLLFLILKKMAWGPMLEGLQKREETIRSAVEEAKRARQETERVRAEFQKELEKAQAEIPVIMDKARRDATHLAEELKAKAIQEIQTEKQRATRELETRRDQALLELQIKTADLATLISARAIRRSLSGEDHRRLTDEALADLRAAGGEWQKVRV